MIEGDGLAREFPWMTAEDWRDDRTEENSPGRGRHRGESDPRIGDRIGPSDLDMIPEKKRVPATVFRFVREFGEQARVGVGAELGSVECVFHVARIQKVL